MRTEDEMGRHPSAEQIRQFLDVEGPQCNQRTAVHLLRCQQCRQAAIQELGDESEGGELLARVLRHPAQWRHDPEPSAVRDQLLVSLTDAAAEVEASPELLAELRRHPVDRWPLLFRNTRRYRSLALARDVLQAGYGEAFEDPAAGAAMVRAGLELLDLLDPERYGSRLLDDLRARGWALIGDCRRMVGELKAAESAFRKAGRLVRDTPDYEELANYYYLLGVLCKEQRRYERAVKLFARARRYSEEIGDSDKLVRILNSTGVLSMDRGEPEEALPPLLEALALVEKGGDERLALFVRSNVANCLTDLGDYEGAHEIFEQCREQYVAAADSYVRLRARWLEGRITSGLGEAERAEGLLSNARSGYLERAQHYNAALVSLDLAALYARQGRNAELKALAEEMAAVFVAQDVPAEAIAALAFFRQAVEQERATEELVGGVARFLQRARTEPGIRFNRRRA